MPNWCHNTLRISGKRGEVSCWVERAQSPPSTEGPDCQKQPLYFGAFYPEPVDIGDGWYRWRVNHWGTKWEPSFDHSSLQGVSRLSEESGGESLDHDCAEYQFDTAWSPPLEWLEKVSSDYPTLSFSITFGEPGNDYGGKAIFIAGKAIYENDGCAKDYLTQEQMWF